MFMNGHDGYIQAEKARILTCEEEEILAIRDEAEASGESGFE